MRAGYYAVSATNVRLDGGPNFNVWPYFYYAISYNARPSKNPTVVW
jgi:hypothetical protein